MAQQLPVIEEDFVQPAMMWEVLGKQPGQQDHLVGNASGHSSAAKPAVRQRTYELFGRINKDLGERIERDRAVGTASSEPGGRECASMPINITKALGHND